MSSIINWSKVSKIITGDPYKIRRNHYENKYQNIVNRIKRVEKALIYFLEKCVKQ